MMSLNECRISLSPLVLLKSAKSALLKQKELTESDRSISSTQHYLSEGVHAYKKFNDLFRGSIAFDDYRHVGPTKLPISSVNAKSSGNYRAFYVILNIDTLNFELKVVKDLDASKESHKWYELKRNGCLENLGEFIKREISSSKLDLSLRSFSPPPSPTSGAKREINKGEESEEGKRKKKEEENL